MLSPLGIKPLTRPRKRGNSSLYSHQIKELEEALGVRLTERVGRLAVPTAEARRLAALARDHFKSLAAFAAEEGVHPGTVTVGAGNSLLEWVVLPRLRALGKALGGRAAVRLQSYRSRDLAEALLDRRCDLGLLRATAVPRGLATRPLLQFGYALFVPEGLAGGGDAAEVLRTAPLATAVGGEFRRNLEKGAKRAGIELRPALECSSFVTAARAVQLGGHAAILPEVAASAFTGLAVRRIELPFRAAPPRKIVLAAHPHVGERLLDAAAEALA